MTASIQMFEPNKKPRSTPGLQFIGKETFPERLPRGVHSERRFGGFGSRTKVASRCQNRLRSRFRGGREAIVSDPSPLAPHASPTLCRILELEPVDVALFSLFEGGWRMIRHHRPGLRALQASVAERQVVLPLVKGGAHVHGQRISHVRARLPSVGRQGSDRRAAKASPKSCPRLDAIRIRA